MLRKISEQDLNTILQWRNQDVVRQVMFTDHVIKPEEHLKWWQQVKSDNSKLYFIFCHNDIDCGVVSFTNIEQNKSAVWGFYFKNLDHLTALERFRITHTMETEAINYAFQHLKITVLKCAVFKFNQVIIKIHTRFGFKETKRYQMQKNNQPEWVIEMSLTKQQWFSKTP